MFAGQNVGVTQVGERIWLVTFMHYDLGYFDDEVGRLEPIANPFGPVPGVGIICHPCDRKIPSKNGRGDWIRTSDRCAQGKLGRPCEVLFFERFAAAKNS